MSAFKQTVELVLEAGGERIVDSSNGRAFRLTSTEAQVLSAWDGTQTPEQLATALQVMGVTIAAPEVNALIGRLWKNGFLPEDSPPPPDAAPEEFTSHDVVPRFREDLSVKGTPGKSLMEVADPTNGRSFTLYDFEVSIARMLNGRRTVAEIITAAGKIGIPVTAGTLSRFVRQMRAYGFIAEQTTDARTLWGDRKQWPAETRELYQSALRMFRTDRWTQALEYIDALLQIDPANEDALALRQRIAEAVEGARASALGFGELHGDQPDVLSLSSPSQLASLPPLAFGAFGAEAAAPMPGEAPQEEPMVALEDDAPEGDRPTATESDDPVAFQFFESGEHPMPVLPAEPPSKVGLPPSSRPRWLPLAIGGAAAVVLAGVLLFPVQRVVAVEAKVEGIVAGKPVAPRDGELDTIKAQDGALVEKGDVVATLATQPLETRKQVLGASADTTRKEMKKLAASVKPAARKAAEAKVKKALKDLKKAEGLAKKARGAKLKRAERTVALKAAAVARAEAARDRVLKVEQKAALGEQLKRIEADVAAVEQQLTASAVTAPVSGRFRAPGHKPGGTVKKDDPLGAVLDTKRRAVTATVDAPPEKIELDSAQLGSAAVRLENVAWEGQTLSATVDATTITAEGPVTLHLHAGRRPLVFSFFGR